MNDLSGEGGHFGDYHDPSFMGATLSLRPEDLDRLDASQYGEDDFMDIHTQAHHHSEPYHHRHHHHQQQQYHQTGFDERSLYAKVDQSIQRSLDRWDEERRTQSLPNTNPSYSHTGNSMTPGPPPPPLQNQKILTPPSSGPTPGTVIKPTNITGVSTATGMARTDLGDPLIQKLGADREAVLAQMQCTFDQRLETLRREEAERRQQLEANHQEQMDKLNRDVDTMIVQHQQVLKLKNEVERGLQKELELARKELTREREGRQTDLNRHHKAVRELYKKIAGLERRLEESRRMARGNGRYVSFDEDEDGEEVAGRLGTQAVWGRSTYEERIQALRRDYDSKIANLVKQFEREKAAAIEILKSKVKAEVNLLLPRLRDQFQQAYTEKISTLKSRLAAQLREQYEDRLRHLKEEHSVERRVWQRQMRERLEKERAELTQRLRAKYEIKVLDIQNECERRILERLRGESSSAPALASVGGGGGSSRRRKAYYDDSFLEIDNEDSFNLNDSFSLVS